MSDRFFIDCNGIIDNWKRPNGDCRDILTWAELCNTLNELDEIADNNLDEYEYITRLEKENQYLKLKLSALSDLIHKTRDKIIMNKRKFIQQK